MQYRHINDTFGARAASAMASSTHETEVSDLLNDGQAGLAEDSAVSPVAGPAVTLVHQCVSAMNSEGVARPSTGRR